MHFFRATRSGARTFSIYAVSVFGTNISLNLIQMENNETLFERILLASFFTTKLLQDFSLSQSLVIDGMIRIVAAFILCWNKVKYFVNVWKPALPPFGLWSDLFSVRALARNPALKSKVRYAKGLKERMCWVRSNVERKIALLGVVFDSWLREVRKYLFGNRVSWY